MSCTSVSMRARSTSPALKLLANPAAGCVWELGIIDFERRAWIEDVLKGRDVDRYLERSINADV
jgi:hypothetical protein